VNKQKVEILVSRNSLLRNLLYGAGVIGLGLSATPLIGMAAAMSPTILPTTLGITAALFGGASLTAYRMKNGSMLSYGKILGGSLLGLVGLQLVGLASLFLVGMNPFAVMMLNTSTYLSVGLFTMFIAYDTHVAVRMY
jgi:FtsH-binding integral membrane protein